MTTSVGPRTAARREQLGAVRWLAAGPTPVVLLHGLTDSSACWPGVLPTLSERRQVLAFDARGHGGTPLPDGVFGIGALAADVAEALNALRIGPAVVVGHSMGGVTAEELALTAPELVAALVLEDPAWHDGADDDGARPAWLPSVVASLAGRSVDQVAAVGRAQNPLWPDEEIAGWAEAKTRLDPRIAEVPHEWAGRDWVEDLALLRVPVTLLTGEAAAGSVVSARQAARATELLGAAPEGLLTHVHLPGVGHSIRREAPRAFRAALDDAIARVEATRS